MTPKTDVSKMADMKKNKPSNDQLSNDQLSSDKLSNSKLRLKTDLTRACHVNPKFNQSAINQSSFNQPNLSYPRNHHLNIQLLHSQQGVALLTILLLVVAITVVAGSMLASQKIAIRQSGLLLAQDQFQHDMIAGQSMAVELVRADSQMNDTDSLQDVWATSLPPYLLDTHSVSIQLMDEASKFNINNLYHDGAVDEAALAMFRRLLSQRGLDENIAVAALDWQDPDETVHEDGGSEASVYRGSTSNGNGQDAAVANQPFVSIEQLLDMGLMSGEEFALLRPYVTAVPYYLPINVNTASPEVLTALAEEWTVDQLQGFVNGRSEAYESLEDIWTLAPWMSVAADSRSDINELLAVDSRAFLALIQASDGDAQRYATVYVSKVSLSNDSNNGSDDGSDDDSDGNTSDDDSSDENTMVEITPFNMRLWAFKPPLNMPER